MRLRILLAALLLFSLLALAASAAKDDLVLVSRVSGAAGGGGDSYSYDPSISSSGRLIAFTSSAENLSEKDAVGVDDVFVRDVADNSTTFVSRQSGPEAVGGDDSSLSPSISADGRYVAFTSCADNLNIADDKAVCDIFVRGLHNTATILVSRESGIEGPGGDGDSLSPTISADGRHIAFVAYASNLSDDDDDTDEDVFVRDLVANTTSLVSRASGASGEAADQSASDASISADGRFVAFVSTADNLSTQDNNSVSNVFVRDLVANTTTFVSRASGAAGEPAADFSYSPSVSADGRFVAFESNADNLSGIDTDNTFDIFIRDLVANTTTLASRATGAGGAGADSGSYYPSISADGRQVAFESDADNLSAEVDGLTTDVFVRNLSAHQTTWVSRTSGAGGVGADGGSYRPAISADGRHVAFESDADNLSTEDNDAFTNVFVRDVLGPPGSGGGGSAGGGGGAGGGGQVRDSTSPSLSGLSFSPRAFAALGGRRSSIVSKRAPQGARVTYRLSEAARVSFRIERQLRGRRKGRRCVTKRKRGRRCTTHKRLRGSFSHSGSAGRNGFRFSGQLGGRRLKPGSYRLVGEPKDAAGNRGRTVRASFRIVRARAARR